MQVTPAPITQTPAFTPTFAHVLAEHDGSEATLVVAGMTMNGTLEVREDHVLVHLPAITHIVPMHAIQRVSV